MAGDTSTEILGFDQRPDIPGFEIIAGIGYGSMGVVWEAIQLSTKRRVALKLLASHLMYQAGINRFRREIELAAQLEHPGIARVYKSGQDGGRHYFCMEYVDGLPLNRHISQYGLNTEQNIDLFMKLCEAVAHAHQRGIIHRDLKPSNILVTRDGQPKILDFGLAKLLHVPGAERLSVTNAVLGTPMYMSPEQSRGDTAGIDARTDVYSLGVLLYELLTDAFPHDTSESDFEVITRVIEDEPTPPRKINPKLARDVEAILLKAVARNPQDRYLTATELLADMRCYVAGQPIQARTAPGLTTLSRQLRRKRKRVLVVATIASLYGILFATLYLRPPAPPQDSVPAVEAQPVQSLADRDIDRWLQVVEEEWNGRGRVIVGRVDIPTFGRVYSLARTLLPDGRFSTPVYEGRMLTFYIPGYERITVEHMEEIRPGVYDAGVLTASPAPPDQLRSIQLSARLEDAENHPNTRIDTRIGVILAATDPGQEEYQLSSTALDRHLLTSGEPIEIHGLSKDEHYRVTATAPGHLRAGFGTDLDLSSDLILPRAPVLNIVYAGRWRQIDEDWDIATPGVYYEAAPIDSDFRIRSYWDDSDIPRTTLTLPSRLDDSGKPIVRIDKEMDYDELGPWETQFADLGELKPLDALSEDVHLVPKPLPDLPALKTGRVYQWRAISNQAEIEALLFTYPQDSAKENVIERLTFYWSN